MAEHGWEMLPTHLWARVVRCSLLDRRDLKAALQTNHSLRFAVLSTRVLSHEFDSEHCSIILHHVNTPTLHRLLSELCLSSLQRLVVTPQRSSSDNAAAALKHLISRRKNPLLGSIRIAHFPAGNLHGLLQLLHILSDAKLHTLALPMPTRDYGSEELLLKTITSSFPTLSVLTFGVRGPLPWCDSGTVRLPPLMPTNQLPSSYLGDTTPQPRQLLPPQSAPSPSDYPDKLSACSSTWGRLSSQGLAVLTSSALAHSLASLSVIGTELALDNEALRHLGKLTNLQRLALTSGCSLNRTSPPLDFSHLRALGRLEVLDVQLLRGDHTTARDQQPRHDTASLALSARAMLAALSQGQAPLTWLRLSATPMAVASEVQAVAVQAGAGGGPAAAVDGVAGAAAGAAGVLPLGAAAAAGLPMELVFSAQVHLPHLACLAMPCSTLTMSGLHALAAAAPAVRHMQLVGLQVPHVAGPAIQGLPQLADLRSLKVKGGSLPSSEQLLSMFPKLSSLLLPIM